jgi:hypothetical protein
MSSKKARHCWQVKTRWSEGAAKSAAPHSILFLLAFYKEFNNFLNKNGGQ